jgi:hypothetical protein
MAVYYLDFLISLVDWPHVIGDLYFPDSMIFSLFPIVFLNKDFLLQER